MPRDHFTLAGVALFAALALVALFVTPATLTPLLAIAFAVLAFSALRWPERGHQGETGIMGLIVLAAFVIESLFRHPGLDRWALMFGEFALAIRFSFLEARLRRAALPHQPLTG